MKTALRSIYSILALLLITAQVAMAGAPRSAEPRYRQSLVYLLDARYYLEHTDKTRAGGVDLRPALSNLYSAIGALDNVVGTSVARSQTTVIPPRIASESAMLHHVIYELVAVDQLLGPGERNPTVNVYRATALTHDRAAAGDVRYMIRACKC
ncbi:MAG: hypothetical protein DLM50_03980 [Candidatus Meridianibacter frigidus]|nr:MAG: hypothetical protein DLM50_03980 [Candidatus Eremiobacteraeota bacterium]